MLIKTKFIKKKLHSCLLLAIFALSSTAFAKTFNLEAGQSQLIETNKKIDTIFVSSPNVADYEILDDNSFMIYAKNEGKAEVVAFGADGKPLTSDIINVNMLIASLNNGISDTNQQLKTRFPNSNLSVKKVGKAYVIEGRATSEAESEEINRIVGEALGAGKKVTETTFKGPNGDEEDVPFLNKYEYEGVVNNSNVDETNQINVKLTIVEVNKRFSDALGINWSYVGGSGVSGITNGGILGKSWKAIGGFVDNVGTLRLTAAGLSAFINALDNQSNGKILAEPNISMLSGETADILVGGEIPFAQRDKDGAATILYKEYGIKLNVGAKLQKNNRVRLILAQEVSTIAGNYEYADIGSIPYFNTRRSKSTFEIANGESFIIGGLLNTSDAENINKVPMLGDIPILGAFFRSASTSRESKELVIVATVNAVKPVNGDDIVYPTFEQTGTMERFFNTTPIKNGVQNVYHRTLTTNFLKNGGFIQ